MPPVTPRADIAVIGGSGLYSFLADATAVPVDTPYGQPSEAPLVGTVGGRSVAFLPRHGKDHRFPAHRVPYRANLWALRSLGVRQILAPCAAGSLRYHLRPGSLVVPDQLVDRTSGRCQTFYEAGAVHVGFADPFCPQGRAAVVARAHAAGWEPVDGGTVVVVEGPRFSTRAESRWMAAAGFDLVNMTAHPEAVLARELALCYTSVAVVTDVDAGVAEGQGVSMAEVLATFQASVDRLRALLVDLVTALPPQRSCPCATALDGLRLPLDLP